MKKRVLAAFGIAGAMSIAALAQNKTQLEFWSWYLSPKFDPYLKSVIADFEKANPTISVNLVDKQDSMVRDLQASIALGKAPDVVNLWGDSTASFAQDGFLTPITDLTTLDTLKGQFWDNTLGIFNVGGKFYGYPWYGWTDQGVMAYNSELLQKAGVRTLPKTLSELLEVSKKVKATTGAYGWLPPIKDPNGASFLGQFFLEGLSITDSTGKANFNSAAHARLLTKFVNLMRSDVIPQDLLRKEAFQLNNELYSQGKSAFIIGGAQALVRVKDANKDIYSKTKVVEAPLGSAGLQTGGSMSLVIPKASKNQKEAAAFAFFMTSNKYQVQFSKLAGIVPTTKGAEKDPELKAANPNDALDVATSLVSGTGRFINPGWKSPKNTDEVYKNFNDNIEAVFLGSKSAQAALNDAVKFWNDKTK
ncbi:MAG: sugar ABC transporter substrate-binding protein [Pleurocapsa sp. SU_196_0]|nr:sugar ABC transporter substrate-binding protein [Pleurocapsa sp. SU_196_0]